MKNLSPRAQRLLIALAPDEAYKFGSDHLLPEHVMLALLRSADGLRYGKRYTGQYHHDLHR